MNNGLQRAFTLVELAIVLVIIGLIVGGVLVGQDLIKAATRRAVVKELREFQAATHTFRGKYNGWPGDLKNAESFWGKHCSTGNADPHTSVATCNGNGNEKFEWNTNVGLNSSNEVFNYWHQLQNAGYIAGALYAGTGDDASYAQPVVRVGWNVPKSRYPQFGWTLVDAGNVPISSVEFIEGNYGHAYAFAPNYGSDPFIMPPIDAYEIDAKIDDGIAGSGTVVALEFNLIYGSGLGCIKTPGGADAMKSATVALADSVYNMNTPDARGCQLVFKNVF